MIAKLKEIDFIEFSPTERQIEQSMIAIKEPSEDSIKKIDFVKTPLTKTLLWRLLVR